MVGRDITPTEIGKHSKLIKAAQDEMSTMDVLVCGRCLQVFHFIEDLKQHKQLPCYKENNNVRECNDTKPKIWAFLLWKATQLINKEANQMPTPNSWALYQTWVKMEENLRETWIVAGKTIQSFAKVGQGGLQEMPVKITKTVVNNSTDGISPGRKPLTQTKPQVANLKPPPAKLPVMNKSYDSENDISPIKAALTTPVQQQKIVKKMIIATSAAAAAGTTPTAAAAAPAVVIQQTKSIAAAAAVVVPAKPSPPSRRAKRTVPNSDEVTEENVEKIVAKRFNPRRKMHEYLVKWEARSHEQNTWEPASYLENVPQLLETFEKQLARQKETRAAQQAQQAAATAAKTLADVKHNFDGAAASIVKKEGISPLTKTMTKLTADAIGEANKLSLASPGSESGSVRPSRTSKTKAMDQVKQWVTGTNAAAALSPSGEDAGEKLDWSMNTSSSSIGPGGIKRKLMDDSEDFNDSNASDMAASTGAMATMEDFEEDLIPSHSVKRMKNGNAVSVEVKTKHESKLIKVNGTTSRQSSVSGESLPVGPNSAEVIITQDTNASGVVKKPGFSGNNAGESAVSNTGIVRLGSGAENSSTSTASETVAATPAAAVKPALTTRAQQIRVGGGSSRQMPTHSSTVGNTQITTISQRQNAAVQQRTPAGTTIQRKPIGIGGQQRTALQSHARTTTLQTSPSSGRMIIPRQGTIAAGGTGTRQMASKNVTPEQKILQLSKSGDLKVTKKVMTREDAVAQRMTPQQQRQHLLRQREQQQQSQVQIQKVQQIAPPSRTIGVRKQSESAYVQQPEEPHQAQLCPITGKIIGLDGQEQPQVHSPEPVSSQQQLALQQQEQQQAQQQLHDIDPTLLLTNEQQMLTNEDGTPLLVTGEDGTVYQVAGKNAEGQTILVTQGPDGEQQFAYVAAAEGEDNQQVLTLDNAVAEAVAQMPEQQQQQHSEAITPGEGQYLVKTTQEDGTTQVVTMSASELEQHQALAAAQQQQQQQEATGVAAAGGGSATGQLCIQTGDGGDGQEANIPAEVVQADLPSPGGTRRVVLLLQDGTFMMTEMHDDEFKALNIAA